MSLRGIGLATCLVAVTTIHVNAGTWRQKITFTFNEPVAIPGEVLPPGKYVFRLIDREADRDVVQVYSTRKPHLSALFLTIPDHRLKAPRKAIMTFARGPAGSPEAVKAWFYPGDTYGHEFVYPRTEARELATRGSDSVPSTSDGASSSMTALKNAKLTLETPDGGETSLTDGRLQH